MRAWIAGVFGAMAWCSTAAANDADVARFRAALECGQLAGAAERDPYSQEAARLTQYAFGLGPKAFAPMASEPDDFFGPYANQLRSRSTDFWIGLAFDQASTAVTKVLNDAVPIEKTRAQDWIQAQKDAAAAEFERRNCSLIGK
jgi:hypothetical protein